MRVIFRLFCCAAIFSFILSLVEMEPTWMEKQSNPWCAEKYISVATRLTQAFIHSTDTDGTLSYTGS